LGIQLSIDDFGTGYSSMAYLQRLPVSELKIDRSFVAGADRGTESRALLRTIIDLGHSLKMTVTAEGVEREEELNLLADMGCDLVQGYLISKPLAPDAARRYLDAMDARAEHAAEF
jgi:EAL domain-containing protein (putative c-di-GMP-specific phosphodiesterase class I)